MTIAIASWLAPRPRGFSRSTFLHETCHPADRAKVVQAAVHPVAVLQVVVQRVAAYERPYGASRSKANSGVYLFVPE
jgi:hypothetical protein